MKPTHFSALTSAALRGALAACFLTSAVPGFSQSWSWREITPSREAAPEPRRDSTMVYDPVGRRLILFGGQGAADLLNDLWTLDLRTLSWSRLDPTGVPPAPRRGHNAIYDSVGHRMVVWAGQQGNRFFNDTWSLDLTMLQWRDVSPAARPQARYGSVSVYDPVERKLVQFAGFTDEQARFQDTQSFDLGAHTWTDLTPPGDKPQVRCLHTGAFDRDSRRMVIYGGQSNGPLDDLWAFTLGPGTWTKLTPAVGPRGRFFATSFIHPGGDFIVFGGATSDGDVSETWAFRFATGQWTRLEIPGAPPARNGMAGASIEGEGRFIIFGGSGFQLFNDLWELAKAADSPTRVHFAQFANGGNFVSSLVLTNPSGTETATGSVSFFDDQGRPLSVSVNGEPPASTVSFTIRPLGSAVFTTSGLGDLAIGSARVSANLSVGGVVRFAFPGLGIAGVPASAPASGFLAPVTRSIARGFSTGLAISSEGAVTLRLTLRNQNGEPVPGGEVTLPLPANGHSARFLEELFPDADTTEFHGTLSVTAEGGQVAGTAMQIGSRVGEFTALPVTPLR